MGDPQFLDTLGRVRWHQGDGDAWTLGWLMLDDRIELATEAADERTSASANDEYLWLAREDTWTEDSPPAPCFPAGGANANDPLRWTTPASASGRWMKQEYFSSAAFSSLWNYRRNSRITWTFGAGAAPANADLGYTRTGRFSDAIASGFRQAGGQHARGECHAGDELLRGICLSASPVEADGNGARCASRWRAI